MTKIKVDWHEAKYKKELAAFQSKVDALNENLKLSAEITEGELSTYDLQELNKWITQKSGFKSATYSAQLLDVETAYKQYKTLNKALTDINDTIIQNDYLNTPEGYILAPSFIARLTESNTIYLSDDLYKIHNKLNSAAELLNQCDKLQAQTSTAITKDYLGIYSVNVKRLNQLKYMR